MEFAPTSPDFISENSETQNFEAQVQLFAFCLKPFQEPNLRYHNWEDHVLSAYSEAMRLCDRCDENSTPVDRLKVAFIILGHDSGYSHYRNSTELNEATGFESKEAYSSHIVENVLQNMGHDQEFIDDIKLGIMATKLGEPCQSIESKIARRADVANTSGPFKLFLRNFINIHRENVEFCGMKLIDPRSAIEQSCKIVESYATTADLSLGPWDNFKEFVEKVKRNTAEIRETGEDFLNKAS